MLAESRGDKTAAMLHFLAAAHLELVLAGDYEEAGNVDAAFRSRVSAGSCFWRGGEPQEASAPFDELLESHPG